MERYTAQLKGRSLILRYRGKETSLGALAEIRNLTSRIQILNLTACRNYGQNILQKRWKVSTKLHGVTELLDTAVMP
jgi:hypothetical protein